MRFLNLAIAAATLLGAASAASAADPAQRSFTRDGHTYVYTRTQNDAGHTVLAGRELGSNARFNLVVKGDLVTGYSNGRPVRFRTEQPLVPVQVAASGAASN